MAIKNLSYLKKRHLVYLPLIAVVGVLFYNMEDLYFSINERDQGNKYPIIKNASVEAHVRLGKNLADRAARDGFHTSEISIEHWDDYDQVPREFREGFKGGSGCDKFRSPGTIKQGLPPNEAKKEALFAYGCIARAQAELKNLGMRYDPT